jgi:hypothetical protein
VLRPRLASKVVRGLGLELVHALSGCLDVARVLARDSRGGEEEPGDERKNEEGLVAGSYSLEALRRARNQSVMPPGYNSSPGDLAFYEGEVIGVLRDLEMVVGGGGFVRKLLDRGGYGVMIDRDAASGTSDDRLPTTTYEKMLKDVEELSWGRSEPNPEDLDYGHLIVQNERPPGVSVVPDYINSTDLFDILAEPGIDSGTGRKASLRHTPGSVREEFKFPTVEPAIMEVNPPPTLRTTRLLSNAIAPAIPPPRSKEDLANEGRARYQAWLKNKQVQPLKAVV